MIPNDIIEILEKHSVNLDIGLSQNEFTKIEKTYNIVFPPDLRELLQVVLPISTGFVNWRDNSEENKKSIEQKLIWPLEGMLFDIEHNAFWHNTFGVKPIDIKEAQEICRVHYANIPKLLPIYSHRYIPSDPVESKNPIFSVHQTDIIYYGENLTEYFKIEFKEKECSVKDYEKIKYIKFWSDLVG